MYAALRHECTEEALLEQRKHTSAYANIRQHTSYAMLVPKEPCTRSVRPHTLVA
jgi:hypothetical protein